MKYRLAIIDVAPFVYKAMWVNDLKKRSYDSLPIGGITLVMRTIVSHLLRGDDVALAFDSRSFRKDIVDGYKKGRESRPDVYVQLDILYTVLKDMGFPVFKEKGMEADDLIYTIVETLGHNYVEKFIYSTDYDLIHNIDDKDSVKFVGITTNVKDVSKGYYNPYDNEFMPFNTKTPRNVLMGDGDYNKVFNLSNGKKGSELYREYAEFVVNNNVSGSDSRSKLLLDLFMETQNLTEKEKEEYEKRCDIFYPKLCSTVETFPARKEDLGNVKLIDFLSTLRLNTSLIQIKDYIENRPSSPLADILSSRIPEIKLIKTSDKYSSKMLEYNKRYLTGEYMVDNNLTVNPEDIKKPELNLAEVLSFQNLT